MKKPLMFTALKDYDRSLLSDGALDKLEEYATCLNSFDGVRAYTLGDHSQAEVHVTFNGHCLEYRIKRESYDYVLSCFPVHYVKIFRGRRSKRYFSFWEMIGDMGFIFSNFCEANKGLEELYLI